MDTSIEIQFKRSILNRGFCEYFKQNPGITRSNGQLLLSKAKSMIFDHSNQFLTFSELGHILEIINLGVSSQTLKMNVIQESDYLANEDRGNQLITFFKNHTQY